MYLTSKMTYENKLEIFRELVSRYSSIAIVGFKHKFHSHYYIHMQWSSFLKKLGVDHIWIDFPEGYDISFDKNTLVIIPDAMLGRIDTSRVSLQSDCSYIFHQGNLYKKYMDDLNCIRLYEYRDSVLRDFSKISSPQFLNDYIYFFPDQRILVQPWGTHLRQNEFLAPCTCRDTKEIFFIGTKWGDLESLVNGNRRILDNICENMNFYGYKFIQKNKLSTQEEIHAIRNSFVSIAPGSVRHNSNSYLQCRIFKNISYGRFTFTDVQAFKKILGKYFIPIENFSDAIKVIEFLPKNLEKDLCRAQQYCIRNYTYLDMWINMLQCLNI